MTLKPRSRLSRQLKEKLQLRQNKTQPKILGNLTSRPPRNISLQSVLKSQAHQQLQKIINQVCNQYGRRLNSKVILSSKSKNSNSRCRPSSSDRIRRCTGGSTPYSPAGVRQSELARASTIRRVIKILIRFYS